MKKLIIIGAALIALSSFAGPPLKPQTIIVPGSICFPRYAHLTNEIAKAEAGIQYWNAQFAKDKEARELQFLASGNGRAHQAGETAAIIARANTLRPFIQTINVDKLSLYNLEETAKRAAAIVK